MPNAKKTRKEHLRHIRKAHENNKLAIFVGAGFSKCIATDKYPSWQNIIDALKEAMPGIEENDFLKIAEHYQLEFGHIETKKKVQSYFPKKDKVSDLHKELINMYPHYIITTNWDTIFEETLEETSSIYDIIASDKDLSSSPLDYQIVKIHGDFKNDNYVFTESDYLNYSYNFPLIEAHLKSILTTHTIIFMGYGFGDYDLKLIMTWLKQYSSHSKNRYMLVEEKKYTRYSEKYYQEYNIILLSEEAEGDYLTKKNYFDFIRLINSNDFNKDYGTGADYVYDKLAPLKNLRYIQPSQIQKVLGNCQISLAREGECLLHFYNDELSFNYNKQTRLAFKIFFNELIEIKDKQIKDKSVHYSIKQKECIYIFKKALLDGIFFTNTENKKDPFIFSEIQDLTIQIKEENAGEKFLCFDYSIDSHLYSENDALFLLYKSVCQYHLMNYEESFALCNQAVTVILKSKELDYYFIALWNYNVILWRLKYDMSIAHNDTYRSIPKKDIESEYSRLPRPLRRQYAEVYRVVTTEWIQSNFYTSNVAYTTTMEKFDSAQKGTIHLSHDIPLDSLNHISLVLFTLENLLLMEDYSEYKNTCINYVKLSFFRSIQNNQGSIIVNKFVIYSLIKCYQNKSLFNFLNSFYKDFIENEKAIILDDDQQEWLIDIVFKNCSNHYISGLTNNRSSSWSVYIQNILTLFQFSKLNTGHLKHIIERLVELVDSAKISISLFETINRFFAYQYNLFYHTTTDFPSKEAFEVVKALLNKFIDNKVSFHEYHSLKSNYLHSVFEISYVTANIFTDAILLEKVIRRISSENQDNRVALSSSILLYLVPICDEKCTELIKSFIQKQDFLKNNDTSNLNLLVYKLDLINFELFEFSDEDINALLAHFNSLKNASSFDSRIFGIHNATQKIIKEDKKSSYIKKHLEFFQDLSSILEELIAKHKARLEAIPSFI